MTKPLYIVSCLLLTLIWLVYGCKHPKTAERSANDTISVVSNIVETDTQTKCSGTQIDFYFYGNPRNAQELQMWKDDVVTDKFSTSDSYQQLLFYFSDHPEKKDEMIRYSEIMFKRGYLYAALTYYGYVKESSIPDKTKLMRKAVVYLKKCAREDHELHKMLALEYLGEIYLEGVYVEQDSIVANYLLNGGSNIDSIVNVRKTITR